MHSEIFSPPVLEHDLSRYLDGCAGVAYSFSSGVVCIRKVLPLSDLRIPYRYMYFLGTSVFRNRLSPFISLCQF